MDFSRVSFIRLIHLLSYCACVHV